MSSIAAQNSPQPGGMAAQRPSPSNQGTPASAFIAKKRRTEVDSPAPSRKKKKALDKTLPQQIRPYVPDSELFSQLLELEKRLDSTLMRKKIAIHTTLKPPSKSTRTVRVFLNSKMVNTGAGESGEMPGWQLRLEGRLLDEAVFSSKARRRFSSFFKRVFIEFSDSEGGMETVVEWIRPGDAQDVDGFEVKRLGHMPANARIFLTVESQPPTYDVAPELSALLGKTQLTKTDAILALWAYIKANDLQDKDDKTVIHCNKPLQELFGCTNVALSNVADCLTAFLLPLKPVELFYAMASQGECFDVDIDIEDVPSKQLQNYLLQPQDIKDMQEADNRILQLCQQIKEHSAKRNFMQQFADDPIGFINKWLGSQHSDLQVMQDGSGNSEEQRRAEFYNKAWVEEASWKYLADKTMQQRVALEQQLQSLKENGPSRPGEKGQS